MLFILLFQVSGVGAGLLSPRTPGGVDSSIVKTIPQRTIDIIKYD